MSDGHTEEVRMSGRIRRHLRGNVIGYVALFVALGGTAAALPGTNTVFSDDIVSEAVRSPDISDSNGVRSIDVRDDTLLGGGLASEDLRTDSVGGSEIAASAVGGAQLENYHVHIGTSQNVNTGTGLDGDWVQVTATASCTAGEQMVGYYAEWTSAGDENATQEIVPNFGANSVTARGISDDGGTETFRAVAVCIFN
jgi:hypothetical protein